MSVISIKSTRCKSKQQLARQYLIVKKYIKKTAREFGINPLQFKELEPCHLDYHPDHYWICLVALRQLACKLSWCK